MKKEVTIIGAAIVDVLASPVDGRIIQNGSMPVKNIRMSFGGDALNEAVVASQLGLNAELISKVGNDEAGKRVLDFLQEKKVKTNIKVEENLETGINIVLVDSAGERRFLTNPASSLRKLAEEDILEYLENAADIVSFASIFVSPLLDIKAMERVFRKIKSKAGRILVADMTTAKNGETLEDMQCLLPYIDYLIPNEIEAERITGEKDAYRSAEVLLEHGASCVIVKRGARGCLIKTAERELEVPAYAETKVVDTTGAGDSFVAGFLWGLRKKLSLRECAVFGCAVASCTVEMLGANSAIKSAELPLERYKEMLGQHHDIL